MQTFSRDGVIYQDNGDGTATVVGYENQGTPLGPQDPAAQYEAPKAEADLQRVQTQNEIDRATAPAEIAKAQADAEKARAEADRIRAEMQRSGTQSETERANAITGYQSALSLDGIIADLERLYREGPGSTNGVAGALDYLPTEANERFDRAANAARGIVGQALGFTGGQLNSEGEARLNIGPYIPSSTDKDGTIEDAIQRLKDLREQAKARSVAILGGVPDEYGNITPIPKQEQTSALDVVRTTGGANPQQKAAGFGATTEFIPVSEEMASEHDRMVARLAGENGGRIDPQAYAQARAELDQKYGEQSDPNANVNWATSVNEYLEAGGKTIPTGIQPTERTLSRTETLQNNLISNPVGAAATGFANAASLGGINAMLPDEAAALSDAYPLSSLGGEIGGAITGTGIVGGIGGRAASRLAPNLLKGGTRAQVGRNVAADATYGGVYSANSGDSVGMGVGLGVGGSLAGQGLGKVLGAGIGGLQRTAPAQALRDAGVRLSVGRSLGGGAARAEDLAQSLPIVGDQVRARQLDAFQDFNREAFRQAGEPVGVTPTNTGLQGLDELGDAVGAEYDRAIGINPAPLDRQFLKDLAPVRQAGRTMSEQNRRQLGDTLRDAVQVPANAGQITGAQFQDALSALRNLRNNPAGVMPNSQNTLRNTSTMVMDALEGAVRRSGGEEGVEALNNANQTYRASRVLDDAANRAAGGSQSGENFVFTPSQLQRAGIKNQRKFGGQRPFAELADNAQEVLPSTVPNSGTTDRALAATALGSAGLGVAGLGENYATGDVSNTATLGALAGALALLGTRGGQRALDTVLFERPTTAQRVGRAVGARSGLFGSGARQIALQGQ
jgi:hypothetical protein